MNGRDGQQEKMFSLLDQQRVSGKSIKQFCEENHLAPATFHYWAKKQKAQAAGAFVAVKVEHGRQSNLPVFELDLGDGRKILFYQEVRIEFIKALLQC